MRITRLLANGSLDNSFQPVPVVSATSAAARPTIYLQPGTQAILLSGDFTSVAGQPRLGMARLVNTALATRALASTPAVDVFPNPAHERLTLHLTARPTGAVALTDLQGRTVRQWVMTQATGSLPLGRLAPGLYMLSIPTTTGLARQRVMVE